MKRILLSLCLASLVLTVAAQRTPFPKYDIAPDGMQQAFLDQVENYRSRLVTDGANQYIGQTDKEGHFYGYGRYLRSDGSQVFGQFRNGEMITGITLASESAIVGNAGYYCSYSLKTGKLEYIFEAGSRKLYDAAALADYGFVSMRYANGDRYVGEVYQGNRHGLGIYFYANGDIWFGQYDSNVRHGFGAMFSQDNYLTIGQWSGEDTLREIAVKLAKKNK